MADNSTMIPYFQQQSTSYIDRLLVVALEWLSPWHPLNLMNPDRDIVQGIVDQRIPALRALVTDVVEGRTDLQTGAKRLREAGARIQSDIQYVDQSLLDVTSEFMGWLNEFLKSLGNEFIDIVNDAANRLLSGVWWKLAIGGGAIAWLLHEWNKPKPQPRRR